LADRQRHGQLLPIDRHPNANTLSDAKTYANTKVSPDHTTAAIAQYFIVVCFTGC
jgi:hypothetical protein